MCFFCDIRSSSKYLEEDNSNSAVLSQISEISEKKGIDHLGEKIPNKLSNFDIDSSTQTFKVGSSKWGDSQLPGTSGGIVSYSFATKNFEGQFEEFDDFITNSAFESEITNALALWENAANLRFALADDAIDVDIRFGWKDIDDAGGVLGQTTIPSFGPLNNVMVSLDISEDWFLGENAPRDRFDFSAVVAHEVGHAIGIEHSTIQQSLMNAVYSPIIFDLQPDDIEAVNLIYGGSSVNQIDVHRFFNPLLGGHFFTTDQTEKEHVLSETQFNGEGVGFKAIAENVDAPASSVPIYRFYNSISGSHLFTAFDAEKEHLLSVEGFIFEGVSFRGFDLNTSATTAIHRFFNTTNGGHFFTASEFEKSAIMNIPELIYEGEAFYAFANSAL